MAEINLTPGNDLFLDDTLRGTATGDTIRGLEGNDSIVGGVGSDLILGNQGRDIIGGGSGDDSIYGNRGNDILHGDVYISNTAEVTIGSGNDYLNGGIGADTVIGSQGTDTLMGGAGADIFTADGEGTALVLDFNLAEDRFGIPDDLSLNDFTITQGTDTNANNTLITYTQTGELLATVLNVQSSSLDPSKFIAVNTDLLT